MRREAANVAREVSRIRAVPTYAKFNGGGRWREREEGE